MAIELWGWTALGILAAAASTALSPFAPPPKPRAPVPVVHELEGRVLSAEGAPVEGAAVHVLAARRATLRSDGRGEFRFRTEGASFRLRVEHPELGRVETERLAASASEPVVLVLERPSRVLGVVLDAANEPIADAEVRLEAAGSRRSVVTDARGRFHASAGPPGAHRVSVWARGFVPEVRDVELGRGDTALRWVLDAASAPHGVVLDPDGKRVAGARVVVCPPPHAVRLTSGSDGTFALGAAALGCTATAAHPEFSASEPTRVRNDRPLALRLRRGGGIEGIVTDVEGRKFHDAVVALGAFTPHRDEPGLEAIHVGRGQNVERGFRFSGLAAGTYEIQVLDVDRLPLAVQRVEVGSGSVTRGVHVVVNAGHGE